MSGRRWRNGLSTIHPHAAHHQPHQQLQSHLLLVMFPIPDHLALFLFLPPLLQENIPVNRFILPFKQIKLFPDSKRKPFLFLLLCLQPCSLAPLFLFSSIIWIFLFHNLLSVCLIVPIIN